MTNIKLSNYNIKLPEKKLGDCGCAKKKGKPSIVFNAKTIKR